MAFPSPSLVVPSPISSSSLPATPPTSWRLPRLDPRVYQIACLGVLLTFGVARLGFDVKPLHAVVILAMALGTQLLATRFYRLPAFDARSPLISALSLCLLLRTNHPAIAALAALVAVGSKFVLRYRGKHLFNPTNLGLVAMLLIPGAAWVSPGQWGSAATAAFFFACLGGLVVYRAERSDVTAAFLFAYGALVFGRSWSLGEPMTIPSHRLQSGAFLLFSFFMISDPRTTPDSRSGRVAFASLVALGAAYIQFKLFRTNGLLWSLVACSLLTPLIDRLLPGPRHAWKPS